jgi:putative oxidoreductase
MPEALPLKSSSVKIDCGLLVLRLCTGLPLFLKHGTEKLFGFSQMAAHFPNPLHIGVIPSLLFATLSDGICSLLVVLGLATRWASLIVFVNLFVAWSLVHHFLFTGPQGGHGELIVLYLGAMAALFLAGPGKYSLDARIGERWSK